MEATAKLYLKSGKEQSIKRLHPWIFSGAIQRTEGNPKEGDLIELYDNRGEYLGIGHFTPSSIMVRILSFHRKVIDQQFWEDRLKSAIELRKRVELIDNSHTNLYRLIHGEGDNLPGLIVDVYGQMAVMQCHSVGMWRNKETIANMIMQVFNGQIKGVYNKSADTLPHMADIESVDSLICGEMLEPMAKENGIRFHIDWQKGQKTGFFVDQRENRLLLQQYAKGRDVLNLFCYTGGFSLYALKGEAKTVHSVDSSARAIEITDKNVEQNFAGDTRHTSFAVDAFKYLNDIKDKYDLIILDPPAFAKHRKVLKNALQGYKNLNAKAIRNIRSGGIIFTFSCSQVVSRDDFRKSVFAASANTGRKVRILHQLVQPTDHPVNIYHPESEYLKGLVLQVE